MKIHLIAIGERMPRWVDEGYREYARRLPPTYGLQLVEIPTKPRVKGADLKRIIQYEGERMLAAIPKEARIWALDEHGQEWSSEDLAYQLDTFRHDGQDLVLLIGGPEGLAPACKTHAHRLWSLSRLTLPHFLVRIVVAEQIYRAWTLLIGHPYHRE